MAAADWTRLEEIARAVQADGVHATAGQVAAQLLHEAIARVGGTPYPEEAEGRGGKVAVAETVEVGRSGRGPHVGAALVESADLTVELRPVGRGDGEAPSVRLYRGRREQRWAVQSIVLRTASASRRGKRGGTDE